MSENPYRAPEYSPTVEYSVPEEENRPRVITPTQMGGRRLDTEIRRRLGKGQAGRMATFMMAAAGMTAVVNGVMMGVLWVLVKMGVLLGVNVWGLAAAIVGVNGLFFLWISVAVMRFFTQIFRYGKTGGERIFCGLRDFWRIFLYVLGVGLAVVLPGGAVIAGVLMFGGGGAWDYGVIAVTGIVMVYLTMLAVPGFWLVTDRREIRPWEAYSISLRVSQRNFGGGIRVVLAGILMVLCAGPAVFGTILVLGRLWGIAWDEPVLESLGGAAGFLGVWWFLVWVFAVPAMTVPVFFSVLVCGEGEDNERKNP